MQFRMTQFDQWEVTAVCTARQSLISFQNPTQTAKRALSATCQPWLVSQLRSPDSRTICTLVAAGRSHLLAGWVLDESTALLVSQGWHPSRHFPSGRIEKEKGLFSFSHSLALSDCSVLQASSGLWFICLLRWYQDHPLGICNVTGQSDFNPCALNGARLLRTCPWPTLTSICILLEFY